MANPNDLGTEVCSDGGGRRKEEEGEGRREQVGGGERKRVWVKRKGEKGTIAGDDMIVGG